MLIFEAKGANEYGEDNNIRCHTVGGSFCNGVHHRAICRVYEGVPGDNRYTFTDEQTGGWFHVPGTGDLLSFIVQTVFCQHRPSINDETSRQRSPLSFVVQAVHDVFFAFVNDDEANHFVFVAG